MTTSDSSPVQIGLIGCGKIAQQVHLRVLAGLPTVTVTALAETDESQRAMAALLAPRARLYNDYNELLRQPDVNAVVIALPSGLHAGAVMAALAAKKHVFVEKPLATILADGRQMRDAWRESGLVGMVGFNYRFNKLYQSLKDHLDSKQFGHPIHARTIFTTPPVAEPANWRQSPAAGGGGALLDLGSHHIHLLQHFFPSQVEEVYAHLRPRQSGAEDVSLELSMSDGMTIQSFFSNASGDMDRVEIYCESGLLTADRYLSLDVEAATYAGRLSRGGQARRWVASLRHTPYLFEKMRAANREPSYRLIMERFINAVQHRQSTGPTIEEGYNCLSVIAAAEESARTGRRIMMRERNE